MAERASWIAIVAGKGGVGKTTTAINLSAALAERGLRCLAVDCDPQSNLTSGLGLNPYNVQPTVADVIVGKVSAEEAIVSTAYANLDLLPAHPDLSCVEAGMVSTMGRELRLRDALKRDQVVADYQVVVFDTPPAFGFHTISAMAAVHHILIPLQMSGFALRGLKEVIRAVSAARVRLNPELSVVGAINTFVSRTRFSRELMEVLGEVVPVKAFQTAISQTVKLQETALLGLPVIHYAPRSKPAEEYRALAAELIAELEKRAMSSGPAEAAEPTETPEVSSEGTLIGSPAHPWPAFLAG